MSDDTRDGWGIISEVESRVGGRLKPADKQAWATVIDDIIAEANGTGREQVIPEPECKCSAVAEHVTTGGPE